jgi:hypothetical protein
VSLRMVVTVASGALGTAYLVFGVMAVWEVLIGRARRGVSRFGLAIAAVMTTCGLHHLMESAHLLRYPHRPSAVAAFSTIAALVPAATFVALRIERFVCAGGDRLIHAQPAAVFGLTLAYVVAAAAGIGASAHAHHPELTRLTTTIAIAVLYVLIGALLLRQQATHYANTGSWSLSGACLGWIFPTCAVTHLAHAAMGTADPHRPTMDLLSIVAAVVFLCVLYRLQRNTLADWHRRPASLAAEPDRPSPWAASAPGP